MRPLSVVHLFTCLKDGESEVMKGRAIAEIDHNIKSPMVSIIIPVYNEQENIEKVLLEVQKLFTTLKHMEVIVVDDGSTDQTATKIENFAFVRYIAHNRNRGKGAAVRTGFQAATGDILVIQDADLEYFPSDIPVLLKPIMTGQAEVVYGSRFKGNQSGMSLLHHLGNKILSLTSRLLYRVPITDVATGYKCFTREVAESLDLKESGFSIEAEITAKILRNRWRFVEVPITYSTRRAGYSKIKYVDGIYNMVKLMKEFSGFSSKKRNENTSRNQ